MTHWTDMNLWTMDDIPWDKFDPSRVDPDLVKLVKAASLVENNANIYADYMGNVFHEHPDLQSLTRVWAGEEVRHGETLARWATLADPDFNFEESVKQFRNNFQVPIELSNSVRGTLTGELLARCVVETGTSSHYTAIRHTTQEPVLKEICHRLASDELRHYRTFYETSKIFLARDKINLVSRIKVVAGRVLELGDEEMAHAYYAANDEKGPFDHKRNSQAYARRVYAIYQPHVVERIVAMLFKIVGLKPHGWICRFVGRRAHGFMQGRARRFACAGV